MKNSEFIAKTNKMNSLTSSNSKNIVNALAGRSIRLVVMGASWGGLQVISSILRQLPADFSLPILIAQHRFRHRRGEAFLAQTLATDCQLMVIEPDDKERMRAGCVYIAPRDYHLLVECDGVLSLSSDEPVNFSRPAIDPLFESAADVYRKELLGIILTGANSDGARGLRSIKTHGGLALVQEPTSAEAKAMPEAAIQMTAVDAVLEINQIAELLKRLDQHRKSRHSELPSAS